MISLARYWIILIAISVVIWLALRNSENPPSFLKVFLLTTAVMLGGIAILFGLSVLMGTPLHF